MKSILMIFSLGMVFSTITSATIINVPADQPTIQEGINAAVDGDTVLVADSLYYENINFKGKDITVASHFLIDRDTTHIDSTIINGSLPNHPDSGSVVYFVNNEDTLSILCGFTITGGTGTTYNPGGWINRAGGGIFVRHASARICHNIIINNNINSATENTHGGGISVYLDYIIIENNIIKNNSVTSSGGFVYGGGIFIQASGRINGNEITYNEASYIGTSPNPGCVGGGVSCFNQNAFNFIEIKDNHIQNNRVNSSNWAHGGGLDLLWTNTIMTGNTISNNELYGSIKTGCGMRIILCEPLTIIKNNVFSNNAGTYTVGGGLYVSRTDGLILEENIFELNESAIGGGLFATETNNLIISKNQFIENESFYAAGIGKISCNNSIIFENEIKENNALVWGGGIQDYAGINTLIAENTIISNTAPSGAGILLDETHSKIIKNLIINNVADSLGGGMVVFDSISINDSKKQYLKEKFFSINEKTKLEISKCQFSVELYEKSKSDNQSIIINNTICYNTATKGGGIYHESDTTKIMNTILWRNNALSGKEILNQRGFLKITYSDIQDTLWPGIGNISDDPLFADTLCHLGIGSPCIDSGHPDSGFNDPEDPGNLGYALWPAMGYLRNDMGAYGGTDSLPPLGIIKIDNPLLPKRFKLSQNYPNPFNPSTTIEFSIPKTEFVTLKVYNILGQEVEKLISNRLISGSYKYIWNAGHLASGIYYYKLKAGEFLKINKLILLK
jgi:hypothetical protein